MKICAEFHQVEQTSYSEEEGQLSHQAGEDDTFVFDLR
jgi:hypothetical protein